MFVQEEKIFAGKVLRLHICAADGAEWLEEATEDTSVEKLKESCLKHGAHGSLEDPKNVTHHKLIHAASERVLSDSKTILEENIQDQDVLLLIKSVFLLHSLRWLTSQQKKRRNKSKRLQTKMLFFEQRQTCLPAALTGLLSRPP